MNPGSRKYRYHWAWRAVFVALALGLALAMVSALDRGAWAMALLDALFVAYWVVLILVKEDE